MRLSKQALARQRLSQLSMWLMICGFRPLWTCEALKETSQPINLYRSKDKKDESNVD